MSVNAGTPLFISGWVFTGGMGFGDEYTWWGGRKRRPAPHEGVDFYAYVDKNSRQRTLRAGIRIPFLARGRIVSVCDDFLGRSLFVHHEFETGEAIVAVYGHLATRWTGGEEVHPGEVAGGLAPATAVVPSHLHISFFLPPPGCRPEQLDWRYLNNCEFSCFIDPFSVTSIW